MQQPKNAVFTSQINADFISISDNNYPDRLKTIDTPPAGLFIAGDLACLSKPCLAIVGTRKPTAFARQLTENWSRVLSDAGIVIISGLALGIDGAAHRGALLGHAKTIAVLGCGVNYDYPKQHRELQRAIIDQGGCVISEYSPDTSPRAPHFPRRNRIISGLSDGVLVMEAAMRSGSLVTAKIAVNQGKEVMAVPGSLHNPMTQGCHWLIREGATLVTSVEEIAQCLKQQIMMTPTQELGPSTKQCRGNPPAVAHSPVPTRSIFENGQARGDCPYTPQESTILKHINEYTTSIDEIVANSRLAFHEVCSILVSLEMAGHLEKVVGGYIRTGQESSICQKR